jgi:hypothetical protein
MWPGYSTVGGGHVTQATGNDRSSSMGGFEKNLGFYAAYHHNVWNKIIHIICVPSTVIIIIIELTLFMDLSSRTCSHTSDSQ